MSQSLQCCQQIPPLKSMYLIKSASATRYENNFLVCLPSFGPTKNTIKIKSLMSSLNTNSCTSQSMPDSTLNIYLALFGVTNTSTYPVPNGFSNFYSLLLVGHGFYMDHMNRLYPYFVFFITPVVTKDEICGGWCAQAQLIRIYPPLSCSLSSLGVKFH